MPKLYELTGSVLKLHEQLEQLGELDSQTIADTLTGSTEYASFEEKAVAVARFIKNNKSDIPGIKTEIDRLTAMKKAKENAIDGMTKYLQMQMETSGITKVKKDMFNIYVKANNPSLVIDETVLPSWWTKSEIVNVIDKEAIKAALDAGNTIPGAEYKQGKSLQIR